MGFVPLADCAPIVMAKELNLFAQYGLDVQLSREIGWATLRDKICYGELDAAHALAPLVFALNIGLGAPATECLTGLVLSLEGNGITLSKRLSGSTGSEAVRQRVAQSRSPLIFGIPFAHSAHHFLLRGWLQAAGLVPEQVARFVVVPPPQMPGHLRAGNLDGFCVGEPWNSIAAHCKTGWLGATSAQLQPGHAEKVLLVRRDCAERREAEHLALIAALLDACSFCQASQNRSLIASVLRRPEYLNLSGQFPGVFAASPERGEDRSGEIPEACSSGPPAGTAGGDSQEEVGPTFSGPGVNEPSADKAAWLIAGMKACPEARAGLASSLDETARRSFRTDIYARAVPLRNVAYETQNHRRFYAALA